MTASAPRPVSPRLLRHPLHFLSLGFGTGLAPRAPGTAGTLVAVPVYLLLAQLAPWHYLLAVAVMFIVGIGLCRVTADALGVHDHPAIVWDEIVGYLCTMVAAPAGWAWVVLGFLLFRLFDVVKPWPVRYIDRRVHGGFGIMLDDLLAAVMASVCLHLAVLAWAALA